MKWQALRGSVVGLFASLGLIGWTGPGVAPSEVVQLEPSFELKREAGEAVAVVGPGSEPTFELGTAAGEAVAKVAPQSEPQFGVRTAQLLEKR